MEKGNDKDLRVGKQKPLQPILENFKSNGPEFEEIRGEKQTRTFKESSVERIDCEFLLQLSEGKFLFLRTAIKVAENYFIVI